jgi:cell division protein FtsQ
MLYKKRRRITKKKYGSNYIGYSNRKSAPSFLLKILRKLVLVILPVIVVCLLVAAGHYYVHPPKINKVIVRGQLQHIKIATISTTIQEIIGANFFTCNTNNLLQRLLLIPWVAEVTMQRVWPGKIVIDITEEKALASWNNNYLINRAGNTFKVDDDEQREQLPALLGPVKYKQQIINTYFILRDIAMHNSSFNIKRVVVDDGYSWTVTMQDDLKVKLGSHDLENRMTIFSRTYPKIAQMRKAVVVDLRYSSGMAIQWELTSRNQVNTQQNNADPDDS